MIEIKYNGSQEMHSVSFAKNGHVITLEGITKVDTSGFTTWRMDGVTQLGDFSEFNTVYRVLDDAVQYSDDGSVWKDPEYPPQEEDKPTQEERIAQLEQQNAMLTECILEMSGMLYA